MRSRFERRWFLLATDEREQQRTLTAGAKEVLRHEGWDDAAIAEYEARPSLHLSNDPNAPRRSFCGLRLSDDPLVDEIALRLIEATRAGKSPEDPDYSDDDPRCADCDLAVLYAEWEPLNGIPPRRIS